MSDNDTVQIDSVTLDLTLRDSDGGQIVLRQIALGYAPLILIEPSTDETDADAAVRFSIDATDVGDVETLKQLLLLIADGLGGSPVESDEV
jgi:hypothetical protein